MAHEQWPGNGISMIKGLNTRASSGSAVLDSSPDPRFSKFGLRSLIVMAEVQPPPPPPGTSMSDHNRGPEILAVCGSLTGVAFLFVVVRIFVRCRMTKNVSWDDWFCVAAWVCYFWIPHP
jgi:hypothetical protein